MSSDLWERPFRFFDVFKADKGALLLIALLRLSALFGLLLYFIPKLETFNNPVIVQGALGSFGLYTLLLLFVTIIQPDWLLNRTCNLAQILGDVGFYTLFYYLSANPRSDIYLLYLLPLFTAVRFLEVSWTLPLLGVVLVCFNTLVYLFYQGQIYQGQIEQLGIFSALLLAFARNFALSALMLFQQTQQQTKLAAQLLASDNQVRDLTRERARWFETYTHLGKRLAGFGDLEELQHFVVAEIQARLQTETCTLFLLDTQGEYLLRKATVGVEESWLTEEKYRIGEGIVGSTLTTTGAQKYGKPIRTSDADHYPVVNPETIKQYQQKLRSGQVKHLITVPLNGQERSFGVLRVLNKLTPAGDLSPTGFSQEDEDFLMTIAAMMAIALEHGRLLTEHKAYLQEIKALHDASQAVLSSGQQQDVLHKIVTLAGRVSGSAYTGVALVGEGGTLSTSVEDRKTRVALHKRARPQSGFTYKIIQGGEMYVCDDTAIDPQIHNPVILEMGYRSYAGLPIITRNKVRGVLYVHSPLPYAFCQKQELLQIFLEHRRPFENVRPHFARLTHPWRPRSSAALSRAFAPRFPSRRPAIRGFLPAKRRPGPAADGPVRPRRRRCRHRFFHRRSARRQCRCRR